jgi:hypothetical protein
MSERRDIRTFEGDCESVVSKKFNDVSGGVRRGGMPQVQYPVAAPESYRKPYDNNRPRPPNKRERESVPVKSLPF